MMKQMVIIKNKIKKEMVKEEIEIEVDHEHQEIINLQKEDIA